MAMKLAWQFHKKNPWIEFDEFFHEAWITMQYAKKIYKPGSSKLSTWTYRLIKNRLIDFAKADIKNTRAFDSVNDKNIEEMKKFNTDYPENWEYQTRKESTQNKLAQYTPNPLRNLYLKDSLSKLDSTTKKMVEIILEDPHEFLTHSPKKSRGKVVKKLRDSGWSWGAIWDSIRTIKTVLADINI